jgi:Tol biopolymer transport system component
MFLKFAVGACLALAIPGAALAFGVGGAQAAFPGENGRIAFAVTKWRWVPPETCTPVPHGCEGGPVPISSGIETVLPSGRGRRVLYPWTPGGSALESAPAWSPNGKLLAIDLVPGQLAIIRRDGTTLRRLPRLTDAESEPTWSPDGRRLAFTGNQPCLYCQWLYTVRRDGTALRRVIAEGAYSPTWSVRGRLAFVNWDDQYLTRVGVKDGLYTIRPDGSELRPLYSGGQLGPGITPDWSPDGDRIAFAAAAREGPDNREIFTIKANGRGLRRLTAFKFRDTASSPVWSPDGKHIAFLRDNGLYVMSSTGRGLRRIVAATRQDPDHPERAWTELSAPTWQPRDPRPARTRSAAARGAPGPGQPSRNSQTN